MFFWNSCSFDDPADIGNLISGSSAFSKTSLNIWKFLVHVLLKPGLENFEHYYLQGTLNLLSYFWNKVLHVSYALCFQKTFVFVIVSSKCVCHLLLIKNLPSKVTDLGIGTSGTSFQSLNLVFFSLRASDSSAWIRGPDGWFLSVQQLKVGFGLWIFLIRVTRNLCHWCVVSCA